MCTIFHLQVGSKKKKKLRNYRLVLILHNPNAINFERNYLVDIKKVLF